MASLYASIASGHFFSSAILSASSTRPAARLVDFCGAPPRFWACELKGPEPNRRAERIRSRIDFNEGVVIFIFNSGPGLIMSLSLSRIAAGVNALSAGRHGRPARE